MNHLSRHHRLFIVAMSYSVMMDGFALAEGISITQPTSMGPLTFEIRLDAVLKGFDGKSNWFGPRAAAVPAGAAGGPLAVMMIQRSFLSASDYFSGYSVLTSKDMGAAWSAPRQVMQLGWRTEPGGVVYGICDFTPRWHAPTSRILAVGQTVRYVDGKLMPEPRPREVAYTVCDPKDGTWQPWKTVNLPDRDKFFSAGAGAAQWLIEPDGSLLRALK